MKNNIPHSYYPRPSLVRDSFITLNGEWDFAYSETPVTEYTEKILVPFPPESKLSGIARTHTKKEKLYYRRFFTLPKSFFKTSAMATTAPSPGSIVMSDFTSIVNPNARTKQLKMQNNHWLI